MEIDKELYKNFLNGNETSFEKLMNKYKSNLIYFITRFVKSKEAAEDVFQDVMVYILSNKEKYDFKYSFKTYLYMIAKSRAINYAKKENRYIDFDEFENLYWSDKDVEEIIFSNERVEKIREVFKKLKPDYQTAIYLTQIENFSYKEVAQIMDKDKTQIKTLVHNSKKKLKELLRKEGVVEMQSGKLIRILIMFMVGILCTSGLVYGAMNLYKAMRNKEQKANFTPTYVSGLSTIDNNIIWVGTFQLVWNDFMDEIIGGEVKFIDEESNLAEELNKQSFTEDDLSEDSYYKIHGETSFELKEKIEKEIQEKFGITSEILDSVKWDHSNRLHFLYAILKKEFEYLEAFKLMESSTFGNENIYVNYFGIDDVLEDSGKANVEILFYNSETDFAIKLKTKQGEEIYLYRGANMNLSFNEIYKEMLGNKENYDGKENLQIGDIVKIPKIKLKEDINYDELCGKSIEGYDGFISQAIQTIDFELDESGGYVESEVGIETLTKSCDVMRNEIDSPRYFIYNNEFILFLKEEGKENPYLALKIKDTDCLVESEHQRIDENS